jgi:outer membrane protein with beta-barrel domain
LRKLALFATVFAFAILSTAAFAQQADIGFGFGTITSPGSASCSVNSSGFFVCPEKGGLYPNISADVIFRRRIGFAYDITWRGGQGAYPGTGQPYRPIINTFDAIYQPRISKKVGLDLKAGIGIQSTRFYSNQYVCGFTGCINYNTSSHFLFNAGAGLRYYVWNHVFVRPEVVYYGIHNNTSDFSGSNVFRVGATIGYTIGPD